MSYQKSPYKEKGINISKTLGHHTGHTKKCSCKVCDMLRSGKAPGVTGYKTGGKW